MVSRARVHGVSSRTARVRVAYVAMKIHRHYCFGVVGVDFVDYILDYNTAYVALQRINAIEIVAKYVCFIIATLFEFRGSFCSHP